MNISRVINIKRIYSNTFNIVKIELLSCMTLNYTIISNLNTLCRTHWISCSNFTNCYVKITKYINNTLTCCSDRSICNSISLIINYISSKIKLTYPKTSCGCIVRLKSSCSSDICFIKLIYCDTSIQERIYCIANLFNERNCNCTSSNSCFTITNINCSCRNTRCNLHREIYITSINYDISNLFRTTWWCKFSLNSKGSSSIN